MVGACRPLGAALLRKCEQAQRASHFAVNQQDLRYLDITFRAVFGTRPSRIIGPGREGRQ